MYRAKMSIADTLHLATFCSAMGDISNVVIASKLIASPDNLFYLFIYLFMFRLPFRMMLLLNT